MAYQAPHDQPAAPHLDPQYTNSTSPISIAMQGPADYAGQTSGQTEKGQLPEPIYSNGAPPQELAGGPVRNHYNMATPLPALSSTPQPIDCPFCGVREMTKCEFASGGTTHGIAGLMCLCFCLGCIPYIGSWLKDCEHRCGNCNTMVAVWHRSGRTEVLAHGVHPSPYPR